MATTTTNLGLIKPAVDSATDQDLWGTELNTNADGIDTVLNAALKVVKSSKTADFSITAPTSASTTIGDSKKIFLCDATSVAIVGSLPSSASAGDGMTVILKKTDSSANTVTAMPDGSDTIDGDASYALSNQYEWVVIVADGVSSWNIIARSPPVVSSEAIADKTILSNISGSTATPSANTLSAILDNILSSTQGSIIYRGASSWAALAPSTSGYVLKTQGAGANPAWTALSGSYVSTDQNYTAVGSFTFCQTIANTTITAGSTYAGSGLKPAGLYSTLGGSTSADIGASVLSGTWRALGTSATGSGVLRMTLFQRIA